MSMFKAGQLRQRVSILRATRTRTASLDWVLTWATWKSLVRASIVSVSGGEGYEANKPFAEATHRIVIRTVTGLLSTDRIQHSGRVFEILDINNYTERGVEQIILAKERVGET